MAIKYTNECVGCPPNMGCLGRACPYRDVPIVTCDECGDELSDWDIYEVDGEILCTFCLKEKFRVSKESIVERENDYDND